MKIIVNSVTDSKAIVSSAAIKKVFHILFCILPPKNCISCRYNSTNIKDPRQRAKLKVEKLQWSWIIKDINKKLKLITVSKVCIQTTRYGLPVIVSVFWTSEQCCVCSVSPDLPSESPGVASLFVRPSGCDNYNLLNKSCHWTRTTALKHSFCFIL